MQTHEETLGQIELCSTLEALLLKKKSLSNGDSPGSHAGKVKLILYNTEKSTGEFIFHLDLFFSLVAISKSY